MKTLISCAVAALFLSACASTDNAPAGSGPAPAAKASNEEYVTGSRLRRSESNENYQGSKTMTGKDYQDYKASTGLKSN